MTFIPIAIYFRGPVKNTLAKIKNINAFIHLMCQLQKVFETGPPCLQDHSIKYFAPGLRQKFVG